MTTRFTGIVLAVTLAAPCAAGAPFYFDRQGDQVVITNVPTGQSARRVPGFEAERGGHRPVLRDAEGLSATPYDGHIEQVAAEYGVAPTLIKAVALVESGFDPKALSPKGAQGLMQLMPGTARQYGVRDAFDPVENLRAGTRHLRNLLDEFDGDLTLALAAYNAGSGAVRRHGGVPAYPETRNYVRRVRSSMSQAPAVAPARPVRMVRLDDGSIRLTN